MLTNIPAAIAALQRIILQGFGPQTLEDYEKNLVEILREVPMDDQAFNLLKLQVAVDTAWVRLRLNGEGIERDERDATMEVVRRIEQMVHLRQEPTDADRAYAENASRHSGFTQRRSRG